MPRAGGQLPRQMLAPASASALAMANPNPPSSETPATSARLPIRSIASMRRSLRGWSRGNVAPSSFLAQHLERGSADDVPAIGQANQDRERHDAQRQSAQGEQW